MEGILQISKWRFFGCEGENGVENCVIVWLLECRMEGIVKIFFCVILQVVQNYGGGCREVEFWVNKQEE